MANRPMRVLHVVGAMGQGGIESWLVRLYRRMDPSEFHFDFCTCWPMPGVYDEEVKSLGGRVIPCGIWDNPLTFLWRLRRILRMGHYDVVHSHVYTLSGFVMRAAKGEGVPVRITHSHSTHDGKPPSLARTAYRSWMKDWIRRYANYGLGASREAMAALFGRGWQSGSRFCVLHCGIDLSPFRQDVSAQEVRKELGIPSDALVVGHVGRFTPAKNQAFILEIAVEAAKLRSGVRFLLVGDGPTKARVVALSRQLGVEDQFIFTGARSDVPRLLLGAFDILVLPSRWEGLGLAVIEAQAAGLRSVVSFAVPPEVAVLPDAVTFVRLNAGAGNWANAVLETASRGRLRRDSALQSIAASDFNIERSAAELVRLYATANGSRGDHG
ncbi:MAG: glycosyltransferase [Acidobacteriia bacterium]|nr:glycosyltransferase [Terriglobia bacterium]